MSKCGSNLISIDQTAFQGNSQCQKLLLFFFLSSGSKWQLNRLDWAFVWALTEAFYLHAHKLKARYSWLAAETWSSWVFFLFFWSRPIFIYYQKKWERETAMVFSFARGFISFSDSLCWEVSKCQRMEHGVFSKHLSTCSHAKNSAIMTNSSGRMTNYSYILWITVVFFKRFSFFSRQLKFKKIPGLNIQRGPID